MNDGFKMNDDFKMWDDPVIRGPKRHWWQFRLKRADKRRDAFICAWWQDTGCAKFVGSARRLVTYGDPEWCESCNGPCRDESFCGAPQ